MTKKQLESLVNGIKKPNLKSSEVVSLLDRDDFDFEPIDRALVLPDDKVVAQFKPHKVAQRVAQTSRVAQSVSQKVAQSVTQSVAQNSILERDIQKYKEELYLIPSVEGRKKYCIDIGFGIAAEKRGGKQFYLYGIKKIEGKKYRLYIGNVKSL